MELPAVACHTAPRSVEVMSSKENFYKHFLNLVAVIKDEKLGKGKENQIAPQTE